MSARFAASPPVPGHRARHGAALLALPLLALAAAGWIGRMPPAAPTVTIAVQADSALGRARGGVSAGRGPRMVKVDARPFAAALAEARAAGFKDGAVIAQLERLAAPAKPRKDA